MNLIERGGQLSDLEARQQGKGRVVVLRGAVASGKTALLHQFADRELAAGHKVVHVAGSRTEEKFQSGVIRQLFYGLHSGATDGNNLGMVLNDGTLWLLAHGTDTCTQATLRIMDESWITLASMAERAPVTIIVDDVHYADSLSVEFLLYYARRLKSAPIVMVLADDGRPWRSSAQLRDEFMRVPHCHAVQLPLLSVHGVERLVSEHRDIRLVDQLAVGIHHASGGNPLLARALIDDYRDCPWRTSGQVVADAAFARAVQGCLNRCEPDVLRFAQAVAVLRDPAPAETFGRMLRMSAESSRAIMAELTAIGLVSAGRFRHPASGAAVLSVMAPEGRADLHMRAAHVMHQENAPVVSIAGHLVAAGPDLVRRSAQAWAVAVLQDAAEHAMEERDVNFALESLRLAIQMCDGEREHAVVMSAMVVAQWRIDPATAARHLPELKRAVALRFLDGRRAARVVYYQLWSGMAEDALAILADSGRGTSDAHLDDQFLAVRMWASCLFPGRQPADDMADHGVAAASYVLEAAHPDDATLAFIVTTMATSVYSGRSTAMELWSAVFLADEAQGKPGMQRSPTWRGLCAVIRGIAYLRLGDLDAARRQAREAITQMAPKSWGVIVGVPVAVLLLAATASGDLDDAADYLGIPMLDAMFLTSLGSVYLNARGQYRLARGQFSLALRDFDMCGSLERQGGADRPESAPWRIGAAEAHLALGEERKCRDLLEDHLEQFGPRRDRAYGMLLRVRAAISPLDEKLSLLGEAIEVLRECGDLVECVRVFTDLSSAHDARGERGEARHMRRKAARFAKQCGMHAWGRTRSAVGTPQDAEAREIASLSEAEQRVVAFAAQGYTNREIADKLYVTASTVEQHLTRAYRKLAVNGRADLPPLPAPPQRIM